MNLKRELGDIIMNIPFTHAYTVSNFEDTINRIMLIFDKYYISKDQFRIILNQLEDAHQSDTLFENGYRTALLEFRDQLK